MREKNEFVGINYLGLFVPTRRAVVASRVAQSLQRTTCAPTAVAPLRTIASLVPLGTCDSTVGHGRTERDFLSVSYRLFNNVVPTFAGGNRRSENLRIFWACNSSASADLLR